MALEPTEQRHRNVSGQSESKPCAIDSAPRENSETAEIARGSRVVRAWSSGRPERFAGSLLPVEGARAATRRRQRREDAPQSAPGTRDAAHRGQEDATCDYVCSFRRRLPSPHWLVAPCSSPPISLQEARSWATTPRARWTTRMAATSCTETARPARRTTGRGFHLARHRPAHLRSHRRAADLSARPTTGRAAEEAAALAEAEECRVEVAWRPGAEAAVAAASNTSAGGLASPGPSAPGCPWRTCTGCMTGRSGAAAIPHRRRRG